MLVGELVNDAHHKIHAPVLHHAHAADEAGVAQADLCARRQAEPLLRRVLAEIVLFDIEVF